MHQVSMLAEMYQSRSAEGLEGLVAFTRFLGTYPVNADTAPVYFKILSIGKKELADILFISREPETFFSTVIPHRFLVQSLLETLASLKPSNADERIILCCLSFVRIWISSDFRTQDSPLPDIQSLYQIAKFFFHKDPRTRQITESLLYEISEQGYRGFPDIANNATRLLDAYHDKRKNLQNIIPTYLVE